MNFRLTSLFVFLFLSVQLWAGGHKNLPAKGDLHVPVFENVNVRFSPDTYPNNYNGADESGVYHLVNGRIILKKITLPAYKRNVSVNLKIPLLPTVIAGISRVLVLCCPSHQLSIC